MEEGEEFADCGEFAGPGDPGEVAAGQIMEKALDVGPAEPVGVLVVDADGLEPLDELGQVITVGTDRLGREILPCKAFRNAILSCVVVPPVA